MGICLAGKMANTNTWKYKLLPFSPLSFVASMFTFTFISCSNSADNSHWPFSSSISKKIARMNPLCVTCLSVSSTLGSSGVSSRYISSLPFWLILSELEEEITWLKIFCLNKTGLEWYPDVRSKMHRKDKIALLLLACASKLLDWQLEMYNQAFLANQ